MSNPLRGQGKGLETNMVVRIGKRAHEKIGDCEQFIYLLMYSFILYYYFFVGYVSFAGDLTFQKHLRAGWIGCLP